MKNFPQFRVVKSEELQIGLSVVTRILDELVDVEEAVDRDPESVVVVQPEVVELFVFQVQWLGEKMRDPVETL